MPSRRQRTTARNCNRFATFTHAISNTALQTAREPRPPILGTRDRRPINAASGSSSRRRLFQAKPAAWSTRAASDQAWIAAIGGAQPRVDDV
jgi:hypothetical protein